MTEIHKDVDPIGDLLKIGNYDPTNPQHSAAVSTAFSLLSFCGDTMAIVLERTQRRSPIEHNKTYDGLHGNKPAD